MQQQQQQALEKQQNLNAMETLNNLFVVAKQQERHKQQPVRPAEATPAPPQPITAQPQAAAANQGAAVKLTGGYLNEPIAASIGGAVAVQVNTFTVNYG